MEENLGGVSGGFMHEIPGAIAIPQKIPEENPWEYSRENP